MNSRLAKQLFYGSGYLLVFFLIIFIIYLIWLKPAPTCFDNKQNQNETGVDCGGPCSPCEIKTLSPLEFSWIKHFPADKQTIIAAEIKNPNLDWGANSFSYTLDVYGNAGDKIKTLTKNSFIYAGEIKYLVEFIEIDTKNIKEIKISFSTVNWKRKDEFQKPAVQLREIKTEATALDGKTGVNTNGFLTNNNAFRLSKIKIIAFLFNQNNMQLSASKTELENIGAFEEKFFKINFPNTISLKTDSAQPASYEFNRNLTIGSKGEDVKKLQQFLKELDLFDREPTDYFGPITKEALIKYQKKVGLSPASGYFGPKTRNYINSLTLPKPTTPKINLAEADPTKTKIYVEALR